MNADFMTIEEIAARRRFLQAQGQMLIEREKVERNEVKIKTNLLVMRDYYTSKIGKRFDYKLSQKIDCLNFLIEN